MKVKETEQGMLAVTIPDKESLYNAYMPYMKKGALFIPTSNLFHLGDEVIILLNIMDETEKTPLMTKVVWVTPANAQGNRKAGIGVQFIDDNAVAIQNRIETYLAGALKSDRSTDTL